MTDFDNFFRNAEKALRGLDSLGAALGLARVTKANFEPVLLTAKAKHHEFNLARQAKAAAFIALRGQRAAADQFLQDVRNYLTGFLGDEWSPLWAPLGFVNGTLKLPGSDAGRRQMLENVTQYFADFPQHENAAKNYTSAQGDVTLTEFAGAVAAVSDCKYDTRAKRDARAAALRALTKKLADLRRELETVLDSKDARWLKFFDRIPGDPRAPERVEGVTATAQPGRIVMDWPDTERAARYKVFKQVVGVDAAPVLAATVEDSDAEVTGVPAGATVRLQVVPSNGAGDGPASAIIELQAA